MSFLTRFFTMTLICSLTLGASVYEDEVLTLFSKIIPRMVLMSSQKDKVKENLELCIVNDKIDELSAVSLISKLHDAYPNGINRHPLSLTNTTYTSIEKCQNSQLVFLFNSSDSNIKKALQYAHAHTSMTMSYDPSYLQNGVDSSLFLGRKVTPYLNISALKKKGIEIDNLLIRISKIYLNEGEK